MFRLNPGLPNAINWGIVLKLYRTSLYDLRCIHELRAFGSSGKPILHFIASECVCDASAAALPSLGEGPGRIFATP